MQSKTSGFEQDNRMTLSTVISPTYNQGKFIENALQSVLNQTVEDYEIIVVNDGSTDNTLEILRKYESNPKIHVYSQKNRGCPAALNLGLKLAKGRYICWLSSDDLWYGDKLEKQLEVFLKDEHLGMVYTDSDIIDEDGNIIQKHYKAGDINIPLPARIRFINGCSIMIKKECFESIGVFDEDLKHCHDSDMWLRIGMQYRMKRVPLPLIKYRMGDNRLSANKYDDARYSAMLMIKHNLPLEIFFPAFIWGLGGKKGFSIYISEAKKEVKRTNRNYFLYRIRTFLFKNGWYYYLAYLNRLICSKYEILT